MDKATRQARFSRKKDRSNKYRRDGRRCWGNKAWVAKWDGYGPEGRERGRLSIDADHANEIDLVIQNRAA